MQSRWLILNNKMIIWIMMILSVGITVFFSSPVLAAEETLPSDGWIAYIGAAGNVWIIQPDGSNATQSF